MKTEQMLEEIREANLSYLMLAQNMIRADRAQALYRLGRTRMREGVLDEALERFDEAITLLPNYAEAIAARAESLDMLGQSQSAAPEYEKARRLWADQPSGAPDRSYLFRQRGRFSFEVDSYELALRRIKTGAFPHLACGNALLAQGRAAEALQFYLSGLKIKKNNPDLTALKGEALSMLGRYREAVEAFDFALAANPKAAEVLNARAIAEMAVAHPRLSCLVLGTNDIGSYSKPDYDLAQQRTLDFFAAKLG